MSHQFEPLTTGLTRLSAEDMRQRLIETEEAGEEYAADLLERCDGRIEQLTAQMVAQAASDGNELAREVFARACQALGWGIAQVITLVSPEVVVVGGGVSLADESLFLAPASLGESVVVHGALAAAADSK
jgi:glucokinase